MHIHAEITIWHQQTDRCDQATEMGMWRRNVQIPNRLGYMSFSLYDRKYEPLVEVVKQFQYLGRMIEETYSDWLTVYQNISKVQGVLWRLVNILLL